MANNSYRTPITGVFNEKKLQYIWTVYGINPDILGSAWGSGTTYPSGEAVIYGTSFEGIPQVYVSLQSGNIGNNPAISPLFWQPQYGNPYYQFYTIVYSLLTGGFTSFYSPKPYFYVAWEDTYLTAYPNIDYNGMYLDNTGNVGVWYVNGSTSQSVNGSITFPTNDFPDASKGWLGQWYVTASIPYYINYQTPLCESYLSQNDPDWINENSDNFYNSIKNDVLTAPMGTPFEDSTSLYGNYLLTTITFPYYQPTDWVAQVIYKVSTKFRALSRTSNM